jgi:hypothetical protein
MSMHLVILSATGSGLVARFFAALRMTERKLWRQMWWIGKLRDWEIERLRDWEIERVATRSSPLATQGA